MNIEAFQLSGKVAKVLVAHQCDDHRSSPREKVKFFQGQGVYGDNHYGPRLLDVRDGFALKLGLPKGMEVFNTRQWSAVSQEELDAIALSMSIPSINHGLLGENMVVSGIPEFTKLPIGTQFFFKSSAGDLRTTILFVCGENAPCHIPGDAIQGTHPKQPGLVTSFVKQAKGQRGLVGMIVGSGFVKEGDTIIAAVPKQALYQQTP